MVYPKEIHEIGEWGREGFLEEVASELSQKGPMDKT